MSNFSFPSKLNRHQLLKYGTAIGAVGGGIGIASSIYNSSLLRSHPKIPTLNENVLASNANPFNPMKVLRDFDYGTVKKENGRIVREFELTARNTTLELNNAVSFVSWNVNDRVPGPTLRATEGDRISRLARICPLRGIFISRYFPSIKTKECRSN